MIAAAGLLFATLAPAQTDAAWVDREHSQATVTAFVLRPPVITNVTCSRPALLNPGAVYLTITWRWTNQSAPYSAYTGANAIWSLNGVAATNPAPTTTVNGNTYTTTFTGTLLGNLLGGLSNLLLGSTINADAVTTGPVGTPTWTSPASSGIVMNIPALSTTASCSIKA
ncbi:hypothetical protein GCM10023351_28510 [Microbacterium gilvum]|uniref:Uncharacterized protein n=1 Tax=Microbacterium gilvum TaxID=1336204 RepID=A0ABP9AHW8_9MICO